jgi:hypothetical protein
MIEELAKHLRELPEKMRISGAYAEDCVKAADELERLQKYEKMVWFIANDYVELSHDKIKWQYFEYKKRCAKLIEEDHND